MVSLRHSSQSDQISLPPSRQTLGLREHKHGDRRRSVQKSPQEDEDRVYEMSDPAPQM
ncbi:hypothetical protein VDGD_21040 [Verticillium dahliae]|nr:hypothetical protein VDGD_21040 [Verticillium dahliae]